MIQVNRKHIDVPRVFFSKEMEIAVDNLKQFYSGRKETRSQKRFTQKFEAELRTPIIEALHKLFKGKCAYCESKIDDSRNNIYDNFRPKYGARGLEKEFAEEHYWWLAYEWRNLYASCTNCNTYKASWFPVKGARSKAGTAYEQIIIEEENILIDPCEENPENDLSFDFNGNINPKTEKGKITIDILKLNRKELISSRAQAIRKTYSDWEELIKIWNDWDKHWDKIRLITSDWSEVLNGTSTKPFLAAQRTLIHDRLSTNDKIKNFIKEENFKWTRETRRLDYDFDIIKDIPFNDPTEIDIDRIDDLITGSEEKKKADPVLPTLTQQIYLEGIEVKNYKCFDHLKLDFTHRTDFEKQNWILLLGENGVGKSSLLKAISLVLSPQSYLDKISDETNQNKLLKNGKRAGFIELTYNGGEKIRLTFKDTSEKITTILKEPIVNLIGYGSTRLLPKNSIKPEKGKFSGVKIQNLFDYTVALRDADEWLLNQNKKNFDRAAKALKDLMLLSDEDRLIRENESVYVQTNSNETTPIDHLSDGYRTIYALTVDIMASLSSDNITYDLAEGIILVDEIGTHLHPRWKMQVIGRLRSVFPKLQFIVTTHEPLCLRGLRNKETYVLTRNTNGKIESIKDLPDPSELRIDQILTSDFFGLNSTLDPKTEALFDEYYHILAKDESIRTTYENSRLHKLSELVPKIKHLGDNLRDELVYYVIDELLAKKVKNEGLKIEDELKKEALEKVKNLWKSIDNI